MDKLFTKIGILLAGVAFFALFSCEENGPDGPDVPDVQLKIDLSTKSVDIPAEGGSFSVTATIPVSWNVTASESWFSVSPSSGEVGAATLVFGADKNESGETRTGTATVSAEGLQSVSITVSQASVEVVPPVPDTELSVSPERLSFGPDAGTLTLGITANKDWKVSADNSWVTVDKSSGNGNAQVSVSVTKNVSTSSRSAVITVVSEEKSATVSVVQEGAKPYLNLSWTNFDAEAAGGDLSLSIDSNVAWKAEKQAAWVTLTEASGAAGYTTIVVSALENKDTAERSATVTFSGDGVSASITVRQKGAQQDGVGGIGGGVNDWGDGNDLGFEGNN